MALILALNPGNSHSPTLARLGRELHGCELIGAESCVVAINAIKERVPDVVLLPAKPARGQADLITYLKSVPGGVMTLTLPPGDSADPVDLARQIRQILTGAPVAASVSAASEPEGTSPHVLAAAAAAINWIQGRRAQWVEVQSGDVTPEPVVPWPGVSRSESDDPYEPIDTTDSYEPYEPIGEPSESSDPYAAETADEPHDTYATHMRTWLPRAAAVAAIIAVTAAVVSYWPQIRGTSSPAADEPREVSPPPDAAPTPVVPLPAAEPEPDPLEKVSGWVAVFAPFDIQITEGTQGVQVDERGRAMLPPGRHRLRFQNGELGYDETRTVEVRLTQTTTIKLTPQTTIGVTSSEAAEVLIDGTRAGDTPYEGTVSLGTHTVTVRTPGAERQLIVEATSKPVQLEVDFSKP